jgi:hypothetical protein
MVIAASVDKFFLATRDVKNSAYSVTLVEEDAKADRYFYPSAAGTYHGSITRFGISVMGTFGQDK